MSRFFPVAFVCVSFLAAPMAYGLFRVDPQDLEEPAKSICRPMFNFYGMRLGTDRRTDELRFGSWKHIYDLLPLTRLTLTRCPGFSLALMIYHYCKPTFCRVHISPKMDESFNFRGNSTYLNLSLPF